MRIIAGEWGGRRLRTAPGRATRPTAERVREALFSVLGPVDGSTVLDLFAGSGALGLEALSRRAGRAVFVERDRSALAALRANIQALALHSDRALVRPIDARVAVRTARKRRETYDLVFLDPPYRQRAGLAGLLSEAIPALLSPAGRVISESDRRELLELAIPLVHERRYGDTVIRIHQMPRPDHHDINQDEPAL
jgi:16S rRNA (guanine966-N2)-methyltransferase